MQYDGIFVAGNTVNQQVLLDYVTTSSRVYLAGGGPGQLASTMGCTGIHS